MFLALGMSVSSHDSKVYMHLLAALEDKLSQQKTCMRLIPMQQSGIGHPIQVL
jgi:hypothetical protein